jgi:uncharacterized membrane protein HdeD (DUF308 family)
MSSDTTAEIELNRTEARIATIAGGVIATLGLFALIFPFVTGLSLSILLGVVLIVGALVHASHALARNTLSATLGQAVLAVLYGAAGVAFVVNPVVGLASLTLLAIGFFLADGVVEVAWALRNRKQPGAVWLLASGGVSFLLAVLLWVGFPVSAVWAVGVLLGVNLLATGLSIVVFGRGTRRSVPEDVPHGSHG